MNVITSIDQVVVVSYGPGIDGGVDISHWAVDLRGTKSYSMRSLNSLSTDRGI